MTVHIHNPLMGAVGFIGREQINICAYIFHIWKAVGGVAHPVHTAIGARFFHQGANVFDRINLRNQIGTMGKANKPHLIIEQGRKPLGFKATAIRLHFPKPHLYAELRQTRPRASVGFVILIGNNNRVPDLQYLPKGAGQNIAILRR